MFRAKTGMGGRSEKTAGYADVQSPCMTCEVLFLGKEWHFLSLGRQSIGQCLL